MASLVVADLHSSSHMQMISSCSTSGNRSLYDHHHVPIHTKPPALPRKPSRVGEPKIPTLISHTRHRLTCRSAIHPASPPSRELPLHPHHRQSCRILLESLDNVCIFFPHGQARMTSSRVQAKSTGQRNKNSSQSFISFSFS